MTIPDYGFYAERYHGKLSVCEYERNSVRASAYLENLTLRRCNHPNLPQWVKDQLQLALCAIAEVYALNDAGVVAAAENDGVSVSYVHNATETDDDRLYHAAAIYLTATGLLYRGCCF